MYQQQNCSKSTLEIQEKSISISVSVKCQSNLGFKLTENEQCIISCIVHRNTGSRKHMREKSCLIPSSPLNGNCFLNASPGRGGTTIWEDKS